MAQENLGIATGPAAPSTFDGNRGTALQAIESWTGGTEFGAFYTGTTGDVVGFRFTMNSEQSVLSLGVWNGDAQPGGSGLNSDHQVGIWDESETLIASATVTPSSPITGDFRYENITPVLLTPGTVYTIGAVYTDTDDDGYLSSPADFVTNPAVNSVNAVFPLEGSLGFVFPTEDSSPANPARIGPNFIFGEPEPPLPESVPVPTLSGMGLIALLLTLAGVAMVLIRRRQA